MVGYEISCQGKCISRNRGYKDRSEAFEFANKDVKYIRENNKEYGDYDLVISIYEDGIIVSTKF